MKEIIAILDCGGQFTKVIDRKARELGVKSEIYPINTPADKLKTCGGIIISGGPADAVYNLDSDILRLNVPVLCICCSEGFLAGTFNLDGFGGKTELGVAEGVLDLSCSLFGGLQSNQKLLIGAECPDVSRVKKNFKAVAVTGGKAAAIYDSEKQIYIAQFHIEAELTDNGDKMLENFLRQICKFTEKYSLDNRIQNSIDMIQNQVRNGKVVVFVSGGVDSAVTAALLLKALPAGNIYGVHVDHGLMRKNESDIICENLKKLGLVNLKRVNAENEFFNTPVDIGDGIPRILSRECDPEIKRNIIGAAFLDVLKTVCEELKLDYDSTFIAQGTLRPDLIESGNPEVSAFAKKIKTHHNDVELIRRAREKGMIVETNWDWHKDEVRQVARILGLDESVASRQPFPGPGLGVRLLCAEDGIEITSQEQSRFDEFLSDYEGIKGVLAPLKSVGVKGDARTYNKMAIIYGGSIKDMQNAAKRIPNALEFVNRVTMLLDRDELTGNLTVTPTRINRENADLLRELDAIAVPAMSGIKNSQCFAALLPLCTDGSKRRSAVLRSVITGDFMTAKASEPDKDISLKALRDAAAEIKTKLGEKIDLVLYDITSKPPATIEWE